jgi:hypothetical protein
MTLFPHRYGKRPMIQIRQFFSIEDPDPVKPPHRFEDYLGRTIKKGLHGFAGL